MTRRSRFWSSSRSRWAWAGVAVALATGVGVGAALVVPGAPRAPGAPASPPPSLGAPGAARRAGADTVALTGHVFDVHAQRAVGGVEVVFRGGAGEVTATTRRDGGYALRVAPGRYRAFVRGGDAMSVARRELSRVPGPPPPELAGVLDEGLATTVVAVRDADGIDLGVVRGGTLAGRVVDRAGHPVAGAVVYASGGDYRPVLATDIATSAGDGGFELQLPPGAFELAVDHPRFTGITGGRRRYLVGPGSRADETLVVAAGCVVSGRVRGPAGEPVGDGALEIQRGLGEGEFAPAGRIGPDGAFRWATTSDDDVALRAWPWKAAPSAVQHFRCRDGARFAGVEFSLPEQTPDADGELVDPAGQPVRFSFVDVRALDRDGISQQERTDETGRWEVYSMPPGRYRITAQAGGGVASATIEVPRHGLRLALGGTGRLEGTAPRLASGGFELALDGCVVDGERILLPQSRRLVMVTGGRFVVDGLPACELGFTTIWHGRPTAQHVAIPAGGVARIELPIGELRDKTVRGVVRDAAGDPVVGAAVTAVRPDDDARVAATMTDAAGRYTILAASGATVRASAHGEVGEARVGGANIDAEQVDVEIGAPAGGDPH